jgi:ribosomal protein S18 acetylase RimI-like enzyme
MLLREFRFPDDYAPIRELWEHAGPGVHLGVSDSLEEIEKKVRRDPDMFLLAEDNGQIIGAVVGGFDGRRGMVYHLAVAESHRRLGVGTILMDELERRLKAKGCRKAYLLVVPGNLAAPMFYEKRGWQAMDVAIFGKEL